MVKGEEAGLVCRERFETVPYRVMAKDLKPVDLVGAGFLPR